MHRLKIIILLLSLTGFCRTSKDIKANPTEAKGEIYQSVDFSKSPLVIIKANDQTTYVMKMNNQTLLLNTSTKVVHLYERLGRFMYNLFRIRVTRFGYFIYSQMAIFGISWREIFPTIFKHILAIFVNHNLVTLFRV